jgi:hypothetical protein
MVFRSFLAYLYADSTDPLMTSACASHSARDSIFLVYFYTHLRYYFNLALSISFFYYSYLTLANCVRVSLLFLSAGLDSRATFSLSS